MNLIKTPFSRGKGKLKSWTALAALVFSATMGAHAGEIVAPAYGFATNYVADGQTDVQAARVLVADGGVVYKQGGGQWTIPLAYLTQPWMASFGVMDGTLSFGLGSAAGSYTAPTTLPASITDKALIWVAADDDAKVIREGNAVSAWYDHRESDISSPQYVRASTRAVGTAVDPTYVTLDGDVKAVYFGKLASGTTMEFLGLGGTRYDSHTSVQKAVKQVFAVICVSNSYGNVFGAYGASTLSPFRMGNDTSAADSIGSNGFYFYSSSSGNQVYINERMMNGRAYLNGNRIDPTVKRVEKGLQLLEAEVRTLTGSTVVSGFFASSEKKGCGGDYLCEAIAFTNRLTEVERLVVEEYLMAKWLPQKGKHLKSVQLADETVYSANVPSGESAETQLALSGRGVAEKTGDGDLVLRNSSDADGVEWDVKGGSLTLGAFAPIKVSAGKSVTVDNLEAGPKVTIASGDADALEKSGSDMLTINGMPSGAKRIRVAGGTLAVRAPRTDSLPSESTYEVPIPNGGFEDYKEVIAEKREDAARNESLGNMKGYGWIPWQGLAYVFDYTGWTTGGGAIGNTRSAFNVSSCPPEGDCALFIRSTASSGDSIVRSAEFELEGGDYALAFKMCGRESASYIGGKLKVSIVGISPSTVRKDYNIRYTYYDGYLEYRMPFSNLAAGSYQIAFQLTKQSEVVIIDDVHLYKIPSDPLASAKWKIPGGDFESTNVPMGAVSRTFSTANTLDGWTFMQPDGWSYGLPAVGVTTLSMTNAANAAARGFLYNNSREPESGSMQLCLCGNNAMAETSITPPAGTYRLEGFISRFGSYGYHPNLTASIVRQDTTVVVLGTLTPVNKMMKRVGWPITFTVDGNETVTLRLTVSGTMNRVDHFATGILLDDIKLVTATDLELFKDGDCEDATSGSALKSIASSAFGCENGLVRFRTDSESPADFGSEMVDGHVMVAIGNRSYLYEDVTLPFSGRYRLSFYTKSRLRNKTGSYGENPLDVFVNIGDATNKLGRIDTHNSGWTQRVFDFNVPSGGVYRVAFQGVNDVATTSTGSYMEKEAHIDSISLKQVHETRDLTPPFDPKAGIVVAEGARLETDFAGTNTIRGLRLGDVRCAGFVRAADYPEYLSGTGTFKIVPRGATVSFR